MARFCGVESSRVSWKIETGRGQESGRGKSLMTVVRHKVGTVGVCRLDGTRDDYRKAPRTSRYHESEPIMEDVYLAKVRTWLYQFTSSSR